MAQCSHYDLKVDPTTKTPYKSYCTKIVKTGRVCSRHHPGAQFPRRHNYGPPRSEDVRDAKRFDADDMAR